MSIHPFAVLVIAIIAVLGGVLVFRLHAFLALTLGAFLVACLTPPASLFDQAIRDAASTIAAVESGNIIVLRDADHAEPGSYAVFRQGDDQRALEQMGVVVLQRFAGAADDAWRVAEQQIAIAPKAGDFLASPRQVDNAVTASKVPVGEQLATGFGNTCASIGLLIAMASIIGKCLLESGAAEQIVITIRRQCGDRATPLALAASSFVVAIPVFFDTVFYLMIPLARAMAAKTGRNYLLYVLSIVAGGSIAHSLVPPTPGPLFVASAFGVNLGLMILGGAAVAIFGVICAFPYIVWANRHWPVNAPATASDHEKNVDERQPVHEQRPSFWVSMLPIALPVVLIAGGTVIDAIADRQVNAELLTWIERMRPAINFVSDKNVALMLAAVVALLTLWSRSTRQRAQIPSHVQEALSSAGIIILITAAGGAFGHVLRSTGIATALQQTIPGSGSGITLLLLAFLLTALIRAAQGSATVAMIATAGIIAPMAASMELPYHPLYLALAIGSGSKPLSWMNDSGFWVVGKMSGLSEAETLRTHTVVLTIMGIGCMTATLVGALLLPLVR